MPITLSVYTYRDAAPPQPISRSFDRLGGTVGRAVGSDLALDDPSKYISRVHARIEYRDGGYCLVDVGSNPSLVNDRPVGAGRHVLLADGDRIRIGDYMLLTSVQAEAAAAPVLPPSPLQEPVRAPAPAPAPFLNPDDSLADASILHVGRDALNPAADPFGLNALGAPVPAAPPGSYRGAQSDHAPAEQAAFPGLRAPLAPPPAAVASPPAPAVPPLTHLPPAAPPVRSAMAIPDDYDPLADFLPPRVTPPAPQPAPAAPTPTPAPRPAARNDDVPTMLQAPSAAPAHPPTAAAPAAHPADIDQAHGGAPAPLPTPQPTPAQGTGAAPPAPTPGGAAPSAPPSAPLAPAPASVQPPAPVRAAPVPASAAPPARAPASMPGVATEDLVIQAFLRGLGLPELTTRRSAEEIAELAGAMLREATSGTMEVLLARAMTKRESRLDMTMIASQANNPLKFFPDATSALTQMLNGGMPGYMAPQRAYANAFDDLKAHELAIMAGMRAALAGVLKRFDPQAIEARLQEPTMMDKMMASGRKAKMWDRMVELYGQLAGEADDDFQRLFGEAFGEAYEQQVQRLRQAAR